MIVLDLKNEVIVYASISWGLASGHEPDLKSVPLGLFYPDCKADGLLQVVGRVENRANMY